MDDADSRGFDTRNVVKKSGANATPYDRGIVVMIEAADDAPSRARALVSDFASEFEDDILDRARLVISELVTNAVRHGSNPGGELELRLWQRADVLVMEVIDLGRDQPAERDLQGGFGLEIVRSMADAVRSVRADAWHVTAEFKAR